jgi:hypothetical protein
MNLNVFKSETEYMGWNNFYNRSEWHENQSFYGKCFRISKNKALVIGVTMCVITPGTNWLIPILVCKVKDINIRY